MTAGVPVPAFGGGVFVSTATRGVTVVFSMSDSAKVAVFGVSSFGVSLFGVSALRGAGATFGGVLTSVAAAEEAESDCPAALSASAAVCRSPLLSARSSAARVIGISPVSSATEMPPLAPRRRRPPARVPTFWPLRANSSATEICPVSLLRFSLIRLPPPVRHPYPYRASEESGLRATPTADLQRLHSEGTHARLRDESAGDELLGPVRADTFEFCRSAMVIREMKAMSWRRPLAVRVRCTRRPADEGAAPVRRARVRKVLEVPTHRSGSPALRMTFAGSASSASSQSRSAEIRRLPGGSSRNQSRVSRPAPSWSE